MAGEEGISNSTPCLGGVAGVSPDGVVVQIESGYAPTGSKKISPDYHPADEASAPLLNKEGSLNSDEFPIAHSPLSVSYDGYGQQILVESREEHTGRPTVWYQMDKRTTRRFTRGTFGIQVEHMNTGSFL